MAYSVVLAKAEYQIDSGSHPLHIHGHNVQLVARSSGTYNTSRHGHKHKFLGAGIVNTNTNATALGFGNATTSMPPVPMRRDTWMVAPNGYTVIRFKANNPGTWFLHCHMEWHMDSVSAPSLLVHFLRVI